MNFPSTLISSLRLAHSLISEQQSASEKRQELYQAVAGQELSFIPEEGKELSPQLRNCAFEEAENAAYVTVAVSDPNRSPRFFELETDFRYHYMNIYFRRASELGNPLIDQFNFVEIGPENYKIEFRVNSTDPPTLQLSFERVENVLAQVYSAYHQYLRSQYEQHKDAFTVSKSFEDSAFQYETESELDAKEFIPQPDSDDFDLHVIDDAEENLNRISIAHTAKDYVEYVVQAEAAGEDYFALTWKHN